MDSIAYVVQLTVAWIHHSVLYPLKVVSDPINNYGYQADSVCG